MEAPTVEFWQRFKIILESLSRQLICEELAHWNGEFDLCVGPAHADSTDWVEMSHKTQMAKSDKESCR